MVSRGDVLALVQLLEDEVHQWEGSREESLLVGYNGRAVKALGAGIERAAVRLFELCDTLDIEPDARDLVRAVDVFDDEFTKFGQAARDQAVRVHPGGSVQLWGAFGNLQRARVRQRWERPTPLRQMITNNTNHDQILKEYHWVHFGPSRGEEMIQEELDKPGTHYNPATFVHPRQVAYEKELSAWWEDRCTQLEKASRSIQTARERPASKPVRESLDDLIIGTTNLQQIMKMKPDLSSDQIQTRAAEMGIALDAATTNFATFRQAQMHREQNLARSRDASLEAEAKLQLNKLPATEVNTYPEFGGDLEGRIVRMSEDGLKPGRIAEAIKHLPNAPGPVNVGRILAKQAHGAAVQQ
jgi:hypothetical protein